MTWINTSDSLPNYKEEVLVWIDGHRSPSWRNNYALVAYLDYDGWHEERHPSNTPLVGVIKWQSINIPD